ncbi:hypothetical protein, partial [Streptomyces sp. Ru72]|uniref:hypothetical protein n=1 Tax=Streptomyces sp. Ru72 TaxID=2080747 RepID=UPI000D48C223
MPGPFRDLGSLFFEVVVAELVEGLHPAQPRVAGGQDLTPPAAFLFGLPSLRSCDLAVDALR